MPTYLTLAPAAVLFLMSLGAVGPDARAGDAGESKPSLYVRASTLQETLLATRQRYAAWLAGQPAARQAAAAGQWSATPVLPAEVLDQLVRPEAGSDPTVLLSDGKPLWTANGELVDGKAVKLADNAPGKAVFLSRTLTAKEPVTLTVGLGGGDRLDVWLNGKKVASADTHLNSGRYGCAYVFDGTRVDQVIVDLELVRGENRLIVRAATSDEPSFCVSLSPQPVPRLWEQVRRDFPAAENPLLELVDAAWFDAAGWLAQKGTEFEERLIDRLGADCGDCQAVIRGELDRLKGDNTGPNDRRWLDLCVKASMAARLCGDLGRLRAAVTALGGAHPAEYPAQELLAELDRYAQRLGAKVASKLDPTDPAARVLAAEMPAMQRRMLVELNPLVRGAEILFVRR